MAKSTFTINEKANKSSLVSTDRFLLETSLDTTMSASLDAIYAYCALTLASASGTLDHTKLANVGSKTHAQIDAFIANSTSMFASAAQGAKADTALQRTDSIDPSQVGLDQVNNTSDLNKPISISAQAAFNKKSDKISTQAYIYVDNTVETLNTSTGTISNPFTSIGSAIQYIGNDQRSKFTIILAPSIYSESNIVFPDRSLIVLCNGATITSNINILNSDFKMYSGSINGSINTTSGSNRSYFEKIKFLGSLLVTGSSKFVNCEFSGSSISVLENSTANLEGCIGTAPLINKGSLTIDSSDIVTASALSIDSSYQSSTIHLINSRIKNTEGICINCDNKATAGYSLYNEIINCSISSVSSAIILGDAATLISNSRIIGLCTGTNLIGSSMSAIGRSYVSLSEEDAEGDIYYRDNEGFLSRLPIGATSTHLVSNGTSPRWEQQPNDISGNAATATLASAAAKLATSRKINAIDFDGTADITISAPQLTTARKINGVAFDGTKDIEITMLDGVSANIMAELDVTNGDVYIDETNGGYAGYIITGSPSHNVSVFIKLQNRYYKFINNITTNYAVAIESGE